MNRKSLGKQIQKYRERAGYSQEKLAEIIECSTIFISYIERGVKSPGLDKLMKIANALDVSVDILLGKDLASYNTERLKDIEQQLKKLPEQEQLKILDMIDSIISIELLHHNKQKHRLTMVNTPLNKALGVRNQIFHSNDTRSAVA